MEEATRKSKKKIRLSNEEKDAIQIIAASLNKNPKEVQEVFLALIAYMTMKLYSGEKELCVPYLFNFSVTPKKKVIPKGFEIVEKYTVSSSLAFHSIISKIEFKETTWIEEFCQGLLFSQLNSKVNKNE